VEASVLGDRVVIGTEKFLQQHGVDSVAGSAGQHLQLGFAVERASSMTLAYVAVNNQLVGVVAITDLLKESTPEALRQLREAGLRIVMLTGDRRESASVIAKTLELGEVHAQTPPQQKAKIVKELREQGHIVAMAGDGINDAPALAAADVGIAMGTGTDVAIESAGIVLIKGDLRGIVRARRLSRATVRNIRQNLAFAFLYNTIGIPIAAGAFYHWFGWLLSPMLASAAMSFSSVSVIANALRLRRS
jgi:Cu+-exporting ATPase